MTGAAAFFAILPPFLPGDNLYQAQRRMAGASAAAVKASGAPRVVMLSSLGADLSEGRGPIKGLHYLESILRESGAEFTAIRACYFQENTTAFIPAARQAVIYPNFFPRPTSIAGQFVR
ncbi:MAG: hypothetical protein KIT09_17545 [Bryobacteraceae bacterium]|nr:hypothetical protein [Bryobacteraceae bacterium]